MTPEETNDYSNLIARLNYWANEPCLPGPREDCKEAIDALTRLSQEEERARTECVNLINENCALKSRIAAIEAATIERCAKVCEDMAADRQALYKGKPPYHGHEDGQGEAYIMGQADGSDMCADAIRALAKKGGGK